MACHSVTVEKGVVGHAREAHQVAPKFIQTSVWWLGQGHQHGSQK